MKCVLVSTGYRNYLAPAACCEAVYTASIIDQSACHASAESTLPARFLGTTRNIEIVHTSCFFPPSVSCLSIQTKVEKNEVAVQCYLFLSSFSACFSMQVFIQLLSNLPSLGRNTCPLQVFRAPTQ